MGTAGQRGWEGGGGDDEGRSGWPRPSDRMVVHAALEVASQQSRILRVDGESLARIAAWRTGRCTGAGRVLNAALTGGPKAANAGVWGQSPQGLAVVYCRGMEPIVTINPKVMHGTPCFAGTRVAARTLFEHIEAGYTIEEFLKQFPTVCREQVVGLLKVLKEGVERAAVPA